MSVSPTNSNRMLPVSPLRFLKDLAVLFKILETVPDAFVMSHQFLHYQILSAEYHLICNLLWLSCL